MRFHDAVRKFVPSGLMGNGVRRAARVRLALQPFLETSVRSALRAGRRPATGSSLAPSPFVRFTPNLRGSASPCRASSPHSPLPRRPSSWC